jgi:hypothetical protein
MAHEPAVWLTGEEWRALRRERRMDSQQGVETRHGPHFHRRCLYCTARLTNGRAVCSDECDHGWWQICPTIDGELYE